jgi:fucose permease
MSAIFYFNENKQANLSCLFSLCRVLEHMSALHCRTFAKHLQNIRETFAEHSRIICVRTAHLPRVTTADPMQTLRATRDVTFVPLCKITTCTSTQRNNNHMCHAVLVSMGVFETAFFSITNMPRIREHVPLFRMDGNSILYGRFGVFDTLFFSVPERAKRVSSCPPC